MHGTELQLKGTMFHTLKYGDEHLQSHDVLFLYFKLDCRFSIRDNYFNFTSNVSLGSKKNNFDSRWKLSLDVKFKFSLLTWLETSFLSKDWKLKKIESKCSKQNKTVALLGLKCETSVPRSLTEWLIVVIPWLASELRSYVRCMMRGEFWCEHRKFYKISLLLLNAGPRRKVGDSPSSFVNI